VYSNFFSKPLNKESPINSKKGDKMDFTLIIVGIIMVVVAMLLFHFLHGVFKIIAGVLSLFVLVGVIFGGIIIFDAYNFQKSAQTEPMIYALVDGEEIIVAMTVNQGTPEIISGAELAQLKNKEYDDLLNNYYKLWFYTPAIIDEIDGEEFELGDYKISKEQIKEGIFGDNPETIFGIPEGTQLEQSKDELRMMIFGGIVVQEVMGSPLFMFEQYKEGNIWVEKESPLFKFIDKVPLNLVKGVLEKAVTKIKERGK